MGPYINLKARKGKGGNMDIRIKTLKFDGSEKLNAFVEKKVARLEKFFEGITTEAEVTLENLKEGQKAKIKIGEFIIERNCQTFEDSITECVDAMKEKLTRAKERNQE